MTALPGDPAGNTDPPIPPVDRQHFLAQAEHELERCRHAQQALALLSIRLDGFHEVFDRLGTAAGTALLADITERLNQACARPYDLVGRTAYDEFVLAIAGEPDAQDAASLGAQTAGKLLDAIEQALVAAGPDLGVRTRAGLALFPADAPNMLELLRCAEVAMLNADADTARLRRYALSLEQAGGSRLDLESWLRAALTAGRMRVFYQPIVDLGSGAMVGAEALVRLPVDQSQMADTVAVIALAQESGLIGVLDGYTLAAACAQARLWQGRPGAPPKISVNVSSDRFHQDDFVDFVQRTLEQSGVNPRCLELDLTEHALIAQSAAGAKKLAALRRMGVSICLDDFGTGYSSLSYLRRLPIDRIKIDAQFVHNLEHDAGNAAVVEAILAMGRALGYEMVAEGVETPAQLRFVQKLACRYGQGYLFSRPIPPEDLERLMWRSSLLPSPG